MADTTHFPRINKAKVLDPLNSTNPDLLANIPRLNLECLRSASNPIIERIQNEDDEDNNQGKYKRRRRGSVDYGHQQYIQDQGYSTLVEFVARSPRSTRLTKVKTKIILYGKLPEGPKKQKLIKEIEHDLVSLENHIPFIHADLETTVNLDEALDGFESPLASPSKTPRRRSSLRSCPSTGVERCPPLCRRR